MGDMDGLPRLIRSAVPDAALALQSREAYRRVARVIRGECRVCIDLNLGSTRLDKQARGDERQVNIVTVV